MEIKKLWHVLTVKRQWHIPTLHELTHQGERWAHRIYLALVSVESHYWYGKAAMFMLVCDIIAIFLHDGEEIL